MLPTTPTIRRRPATPAEAAAIVAKAERLNATPSLEAVDLYLPAEYVAEFHRRAKVIHQIQGGQVVVLAASAVVSQLQNDAALGLLTIEEPATV